MTEAEIKRIHEAAQRTIDQDKDSFSVSELAVIARSQYFNIEALFTYGANMTTQNMSERIEIDDMILGLCQRFIKNVGAIPDAVTWSGQDQEVERVKGIQSEVSKTKELHLAIQDYRDNPTPAKEARVRQMMGR